MFEERDVRVIRIGQRFPLFVPHLVYRTPTSFRVDHVSTGIILSDGEGARVPMYASAIPGPSNRGLELFPLEPKKSYEFGNLNYDPWTRAKYLKHIMGRSTSGNGEIQLLFNCSADYGAFDERIPLSTEDVGYTLAKRVRLSLIVPDTTYIGIAHWGKVPIFDNFYPEDFLGRVPAIPLNAHPEAGIRWKGYTLREGNPLLLPITERKLSSVEAEFSLGPVEGVPEAFLNAFK